MQKNTLIILIVLVVVGGGLGIYKLFGQEGISAQEPVMCTMEALMCPDGSYVGRSGPTCAFKVCPNAESFVGTLRQNTNGFTLEMSAPSEGQEVAYTMPLKIQVSNVVGQLVNQKVRVYGSFTEGSTLTVDHLEELSGAAGNPVLGDIKVGQTVFVNGVKITLQKIVSDSRCPAGVQCVWAGEVSVQVKLQSNTDSTTQTISSSKPISFDSYKISIETVKPTKVSSKSPSQGSYIVTFKVEPLN